MKSLSGRARSVALAACLALGTGGALVSCRSASPAPQAANAGGSAATAHSADDVRFLQDISAHHQQGVELTAMAPAHTADAALVGLAQQLEMVQLSEIQGFKAQLLQWEESPRRDGGELVGMADQHTMDQLGALHGPAFDKLWLRTMIAHGRGGIAMAHNEIEHGQSPDIIGLARTVTQTQQVGVDQLTKLLDGS